MKLRYLVIGLLLLTLFAPVGCQKTESTIEILPYSQPQVAEKAIVVNISSKTIHLDPDCTYLQKVNRNNLRTADDDNDTLHTLLGMGYTLCSDCQNKKNVN